MILSCSNIDVNTKRVVDLYDEIKYLDQVNRKIYFKSEAYKLILFAMKEEHALKPYWASIDTLLIILKGQVQITIDDKAHILNSNESMMLSKNINHRICPITNVKFVLIK